MLPHVVTFFTPCELEGMNKTGLFCFSVSLLSSLLLSSSEEDDALYEKLSEEQWRLECLMQLLADLKHCDLPGDFFLDLLQVGCTHL